MNKKLLLRIQTIFFLKLQVKTGWGRNDIMQAYNDAVSEALMETLD